MFQSVYSNYFNNTPFMMQNPWMSFNQTNFLSSWTPNFTFNSQFGAFNNGFPVFNFANQWGTFDTFSYNGVSSKSSSSPKALTKEEKDIDKQNKNLIKLLEALLANNNNILDADEKKDLRAAVNEAKRVKDIKEKNDALTSLYNDYSDVVSEYITSEDVKNIRIEDRALADALNATGYQRSSHISGVTELYDSIKALSDTQSALGDNVLLTDLAMSKPKNNVLAVISDFNSLSSSVDDNLINLLVDKRNGISDPAKRAEADKLIKNLVSKLSAEAEKQLEAVDDIAKFDLKGKITSLKETTKYDKDFIKKFNEIYALTRILAVRTLAHKLSDMYGKIDSNLFREDMFIDATRDDLNSEFNSVAPSVDMVMNIKLKNKGSRVAKDRKIDDKTPEEQLLSLIENNMLAETGKKITRDGQEYTIYEIPSGDNNRAYIQCEDSFYEVVSQDNKQIVGQKATAGSIQNAAIEGKKKAEQAQKEEAARIEKTISDERAKIVAVLGHSDIVKTNEVIDKSNICPDVYYDMNELANFAMDLGVSYHFSFGSDKNKKKVTLDLNESKYTVYKNEKTGEKYIVIGDKVCKVTGALFACLNSNIPLPKLMRQAHLDIVTAEGVRANKYKEADDEVVRTGRLIYSKSDDYTNDQEDEEINNSLMKANKENVIGILSGYYDASEEFNIVTQLKEEDNVKMSAILNVVTSLLQRAHEYGIRNGAYVGLVSILNTYYGKYDEASGILDLDNNVTEFKASQAIDILLFNLMSDIEEYERPLRRMNTELANKIKENFSHKNAKITTNREEILHLVNDYCDTYSVNYIDDETMQLRFFDL